MTASAAAVNSPGTAMSLLHDATSIGLATAGWILLLPALAAALACVRRGFLPRGAAEHAWLGGAVLVAVLWTVQIRAGGAPAFGMLGAALYALVFGWARGLLGLAAALVLNTALNDGSWINLGLNGVLLAVLPASLASAMRWQVERRLPRNPFVFMIGNGMFASLAATALTRLAIVAVCLAAAPFRATVTLGEYVAATMLLAWSEALLSGMVLTALVVFLPAVVLTLPRDVDAPARSG
jgi:uncharacterized membrane protein